MSLNSSPDAEGTDLHAFYMRLAIIFTLPSRAPSSAAAPITELDLGGDVIVTPTDR
jgi:hypothetical protein